MDSPFLSLEGDFFWILWLKGWIQYLCALFFSFFPLCLSHSLTFFPTWADRRAARCTYTLRFPSPRSQLSILQCVALSSHTSPSLPFSHSCLLSLPLSSCFFFPLRLLSSCRLTPSFPSFSPFSLFLFINLLGCYSPCLALLMKAGCRWGRRSSL